MRTKREWYRSTWKQPNGNERLRLAALHEFLDDRLAANEDADEVRISVVELREVLKLTEPGPMTVGAQIVDKDRGVAYRVTLDETTKPDEARLRSVEVIRSVIGDGLAGWTMKGGPLRRKGKPGTYLAPYDESVFRIPIQVLVSQALAVQAKEFELTSDEGVRGIVIGARKLAPPTPEELREHLRAGMNPPQIAERYERAERTVYGWLEAARSATPELDWPPVKHRPIPQTPRDARSQGQPKKRETK